jgi:hypothetical protein
MLNPGRFNVSVHCMFLIILRLDRVVRIRGLSALQLDPVMPFR